MTSNDSAIGVHDRAGDGTPIEIMRRIGGGRSVPALSALLPRGASILDLGSGSGRLSDPLAELGHRVVAVDESAEMLAHVQHAETVRSRIEDLNLAERFAGVILPSYLVNTPDVAQRRHFLAACSRHVAPDGIVMIQRMVPPMPYLRDGVRLERNGVRMLLEDVTKDGLRATATLVYQFEGATLRQPWELLVMEEEELDRELARAGLTRTQTLEELAWVVARPHDA